MNDDRRYLIHEISLATGIPDKTLHSRRRTLKIPANGQGYTLEEVKLMIKRPARRSKADKRMAADLQKRLKNDGAL
jgi:hypothetical protein